MRNPKQPTRKKLRELFDYRDGRLIWRLRTDKIGRPNTRYVGTIAGSLSRADGRRRVSVDGRGCLASRIVWIMHHGSIPAGMEIDHVNRNQGDDRIGNLRLATRTQNTVNTRKRPGASSRYVGVCLDARHGIWIARTRRGGRRVTLGSFGSEVDAARAYDAHIRTLGCVFSPVNFEEARPC